VVRVEGLVPAHRDGRGVARGLAAIRRRGRGVGRRRGVARRRSGACGERERRRGQHGTRHTESPDLQDSSWGVKRTAPGRARPRERTIPLTHDGGYEYCDVTHRRSDSSDRWVLPPPIVTELILTSTSRSARRPPDISPGRAVGKTWTPVDAASIRRRKPCAA